MKRIKSLLLLAFFSALFLHPNLYCQNQRIYIAPDDHSDIWWSADLATYNQAFLTMLDYYINLSDNTQNEPSNYQSRWNCDGSYWMWDYEKNRSTEQFQKLISYIKSGHISVPLNPMVVVLGGTPAEAVIRGMYYPGKIEREYGVSFPLAYSMENQTLPLGLATLWKEAGARYSWKGVCQCATNVDATNREHEIYWMQGLDDSRILMKWYSLSDYGDIDSITNPNMGPGGYAEARYPQASIDYVENNQKFKARYPYPVIGLFGKGWDNLETTTDEFITVAKSDTNANDSLIVSNEIDFFKDFEANYGNDIATERLSFGNDWDLGSAAIQEISSRLKRATEKLRNAEALAVFASLPDPSFLNGRSDSKDQAWMDMGMYFEHNITFPGPNLVNAASGRIEWQRQLVGEIETYIDTLQIDAIKALGKGIINTSGNARFFVFNSLNWSRTDVADLEYNQSGPAKVIDVTNNQEVPSQFVSINGKTYLRILARDIPPVGYKVFEVIKSTGENFQNAATITGNKIENSFYILDVSQKGSVNSILSKKHNNQEFIQSIDGKTVNDLGGSVSGSLSIENSGPVSVSFLVNSSSVLDHTTRITLFRDIDRIDIDNIINQNFTDTETWSFGFNIPDHTIRHEEVGSVLTARTNSNGGNYSDQNANYEWLTMNHFADISNDNFGVTLSNADCYFMKIGNSSVTNLDQDTPQISVLAGGRIYDRGLPHQGGDNSFTQRFALMTHNEYSPASAMRFSLEHQNPLISGKVTGGTIYPEKSMSLISTDNPDVLLWSLKPSEDGIESGVTARFWNLSESSNNFSIGSNYQILSAQNLTLIETPVSTADVLNNRISGQVNSFGFKTYNIKINFESSKSLSVSPSSKSVGSAAGLTTFTVTSKLDWSVSDSSAWLATTKTNDSTITVNYDQNTSVLTRTAYIVVSGSDGAAQTVSVTQAPVNASLDVFPGSRTVSSASGYTSFTVTSNVGWNVTDIESWLTAFKNDTSTIGVAYDKNTSLTSRTGSIMITGIGELSKTVTLIQEADSVADSSKEVKDFVVSIYPNPLTDFLIVRFGTTIYQRIFFSVADELGRKIYASNFDGSGTSDELILDLSFLTRGFYFFSVRVGNILKAYKIIRN